MARPDLTHVSRSRSAFAPARSEGEGDIVADGVEGQRQGRGGERDEEGEVIPIL